MSSVFKERLIAQLLDVFVWPGASIIISELPIVLELALEDDNKADGDEPGGHEPGDGELLAHDAGVSVHGEGLKPFNGHSEDREEARDHRDHKEAVDKGVLVAGDIKDWRKGEDPVEEEAEGEEDRGEDVRVGEEPVSHGLVDELGDEDDGGDDTRHEADGADNNVEVCEIHVRTGPKEADEESQDEDPDTDYEVNCDHTHGPETILTLVPRCL